MQPPRPTCGPLPVLPSALKCWGPPRQQGLCSHPSHLWATFDYSRRSEVVGPPKRQGISSRPAYLWAISNFAPRTAAVGTPQCVRGYAATWPTCGPLLILPSALKWLGPPMQQGLCSHVAHFWATSDPSRRSEEVGLPRRQGVSSRLAHLWATSDSAPCSETVGKPQAAAVM